MSYATSDSNSPNTMTAGATTTAQDEVGRHLTENILTLQQTIRNIRQDVESGIAPSILIPAATVRSLIRINLNSTKVIDHIQTEGIEDGMVYLSLEPSTSTLENYISPLDDKLHILAQKLQDRRHWHPPINPPKSPEFSIIDLSDLTSAIELLEDIFYWHLQDPKPLSPQSFFSKHKWTWDPLWKEFYAQIPGQSSWIYLSHWRLDEQRQNWEHVSMNGADLLPNAAAELLGSWDDWTWDPVWGEWCLDVSNEEEKMFIYANRWRMEGGEWVHTRETGKAEA